MPKVAVIVPIYNVEQYVQECITSLTCQTLQDIEIICVDDCGTDKSMEIVERLAKTDERIKVIHNKQNSGLSESRNNGMKHATAPYIMFCDSDDFFAPNMCEVMYEGMENTGAELGIFGFEVIYEANFDKKDADDRYFAVRHQGCLPLTQEIQDAQPVCACGKIYRRSIIENNDMTFPKGLKHEDEFWFPAYCTWVKNILFVKDKFYKYRRRAGSIMNTVFQKKRLQLDLLLIAIEYFEYIKKHNQLDERLDWFWGNKFFDLLGGCIGYSGHKHSNECYRVAHEFIRKNCDLDKLGWVAQRKVQIIMNKTVRARRFCGGLIRKKENVHKKTIQVAGITIWRKKYHNN